MSGAANVVYFELIPHTLPCFCKYSLEPQMYNNPWLKIIPNKCTYSLLFDWWVPENCIICLFIGLTWMGGFLFLFYWSLFLWHVPIFRWNQLSVIYSARNSKSINRWDGWMVHLLALMDFTVHGVLILSSRNKSPKERPKPTLCSIQPPSVSREVNKQQIIYLIRLHPEDFELVFKSLTNILS